MEVTVEVTPRLVRHLLETEGLWDFSNLGNPLHGAVQWSYCEQPLKHGETVQLPVQSLPLRHPVRVHYERRRLKHLGHLVGLLELELAVRVGSW